MVEETGRMKASLQKLPEGYAVRIHVGGGYGDPYVWSCIVELTGKDSCTIQLVDRAPSRQEIRALREALNEVGITKASWERVREGKRTRTRDYS